MSTRWLLCAALALAACTAPAPRPDGGEPPDAGEPDAGRPARLDWTNPAQRFALGAFDVETCGNLVVCATHPELGWGALKIDAYEARTYDHFAEVWDGGQAPFDALREVIDDSRALVERDRQAGCPAGTVVRLLPTREVPVGGQPGLAWGFDVFTADGGVREKSRQYATLHGDHLLFWNVAGMDRRLGCLEVIGEFTPEAFALIEPYLDTLAAQMVLPDGGL